MKYKTTALKILFIIPSLSAGGAEKVMSFLAQNLNDKKFQTKLVVIGFEKNNAYDISNVDTIYLNNTSVGKAFMTILKLVRSEKPNVVLSSLSHLNAIMGYVSYFNPKTIFIGRQTIVQSAQKDFTGRTGIKTKLFNFAYYLGYKGLNKLISQSDDMKNDLVQNQGVNEEKVVTINNPVSQNFKVKDKIPEIGNFYQFITVGRLTEKKGYNRILNILFKFKLPFHYTIIGDGQEKASIQELADKLNLTDKITYISFTDKVNDYLTNSHVYLQGSFVEGFPNALIESISVGTPAIVFNAPGGMNEIMLNGENGYLVDNEEMFSEKLESIVNDIKDFTPTKVSAEVRRKYSSAQILSQYEDLFESLITNKS
ncbi:glycosyltransferase [Maribacter arcticus]|uniref:Glycosyltransferase involved in cell wall bisynthesis n=1 Tax=Maribacter arcticus TaxID=561365 RepID=A0A1T5BGW5_9FLAO|nr:glycosyltransferase [Maribacter arcticus]SKB46488.1 Glycosyltransferase involved in cell wall bisynthesis [Maribacter arcticus]